MTSPGLGMGASDGEPGHWSGTCYGVLVVVVFRSVVAGSRFVTLDSTPLQSGGGPVFRQNSLTCRGSVLRTDHSTLV